MMASSRPSIGVAALAFFFVFGAAMATLSCIALLFPGHTIDQLWRLNPEAHAAFRAMGGWAIALMVVLAVLCASSAVGLWTRTRWGHRLALLVLGLNLLGDTGNALIRGDLRALVGLPIGGLFIAYLLSRPVRSQFSGPY
jgi:uncharacterized membrane protein (DUF2068 family)